MSLKLMAVNCLTCAAIVTALACAKHTGGDITGIWISRADVLQHNAQSANTDVRLICEFADDGSARISAVPWNRLSGTPNALQLNSKSLEYSTKGGQLQFLEQLASTDNGTGSELKQLGQSQDYVVNNSVLTIVEPVDPAFPLQAGMYIAINDHPDIIDFISQRMIKLAVDQWAAADQSQKLTYEQEQSLVWLWLPEASRRNWTESSDREPQVPKSDQSDLLARHVYQKIREVNAAILFDDFVAGLSPEEVDAMLVSAVADDDYTLAQKLVRREANCNAILPDGRNLLHLCAERRMMQMAELLLAGGADELIPDREGHYPAESAIEAGNYPLAETLGLQPEYTWITSKLDELEWNYAAIFAYKWRYLPRDGKLTADSAIYLDQFEQTLQALESMYVELVNANVEQGPEDSALNSRFMDSLRTRIKRSHDFCCNEIHSIYELDDKRSHPIYSRLPDHRAFARANWPMLPTRYEVTSSETGFN